MITPDMIRDLSPQSGSKSPKEFVPLRKQDTKLNYGALEHTVIKRKLHVMITIAHLLERRFNTITPR